MRAAQNERLVAAVLPEHPVFVAPEQFVGEELSEDDLAYLRHFIELGLQPVDQFHGFPWVEQFQPSAMRYQINGVGYLLSLANYARVPAFHGYLAQAQRNLIEKMLVKDVWKYWRLENLWGNLRADPDPIAHENIMLSGFYGLQLGMYESATGDHRYAQPGALTFRWDDDTAFAYDVPAINEALRRQLLDSSYGAFACEPNWVYLYCNERGMLSLIMNDRERGTAYADEVADGLRIAIEHEFVNPDGSHNHVRSTRFGFGVNAKVMQTWNSLVESPSYSVAVVAPYTLLKTEGGAWKAQRAARRAGNGRDATMSVGGLAPPELPLGAIFPDLLERDLALGTWQATRDAVLSGGMDLHKISAANTSLGPMGRSGPAYLTLLSYSREYGDDEVTDFILDAFATDPHVQVVDENGAKRFEGMIPWRASNISIGRYTRQGAYYDIINRGLRPEWKTGPILEDAPYPDVLVARAVTDGVALSLVLRPGPEHGRAQLALARLTPGRRYRGGGILEDDFTADPTGRAVVTVDLDARLEVEIRPIVV